MRRISWISAVSCTALLAGVVASSCGDTSSIDNGTGGAAAGMGGRGTGGAPVTGTGGMTTPPPGTGGRATGTGGMQRVDAGPPPADGGGPTGCMTGAMCTTGCTATCMVGGMTGTRACTCSAAGRVNCPVGGNSCMVAGADAGPPPADGGGPTGCMTGAMCTTGCTATCMVGGMAGTRACTCSAAGRVNCPIGGGSCMVAGADGGMPPPRCIAGTACTTGCAQMCFANGMMGTRDCTCGANGMLTCPMGAASCMVAGRDAAAD